MKMKFLALAGLACILQADMYVGLQGGYSAQTSYLSNKSSITPTSTISAAFSEGMQGFSIGGVVGSEESFEDFFGIRWGLDLGYTQLASGSLRAEFLDVGLSADLIVDFLDMDDLDFGIFGGASADYHYGLGDSKHFFDFAGRVGVTTLWDGEHRIDLMAKLPIASIHTQSTQNRLLSRTSFLASYKFIF